MLLRSQNSLNNIKQQHSKYVTVQSELSRQCQNNSPIQMLLRSHNSADNIKQKHSAHVTAQSELSGQHKATVQCICYCAIRTQQTLQNNSPIQMLLRSHNSADNIKQKHSTHVTAQSELSGLHETTAQYTQMWNIYRHMRCNNAVRLPHSVRNVLICYCAVTTQRTT
jgi:hypothetical protein